MNLRLSTRLLSTSIAATVGLTLLPSVASAATINVASK